MKRLGMVYGGSVTEYRVLSDARFARWFAETVYLPELSEADLESLDGLLVPEGSHHRKLRAAGGAIRAFLDRGGTAIAFGDQPFPWLPGMAWTFRPALPLTHLTTEHSDDGFHHHVPLDGAIWHHHGVFAPPAGGDTLLAADDGAAVLYVDRVSTNGTMVISSLDPLRHTGETAMPAAALFLERFLPWVVLELLETSRQRPAGSS